MAFFKNSNRNNIVGKVLDSMNADNRRTVVAISLRIAGISKRSHSVKYGK